MPPCLYFAPVMNAGIRGMPDCLTYYHQLSDKAAREKTMETRKPTYVGSTDVDRMVVGLKCWSEL